MDASRWGIAAALATLLLVGCNHAGQRDLVERELRTQEDRIYQLQGYIEEYQAMLESSRRENDSLKKELGRGGEDAAPPNEGRPTHSARPTSPAMPFRPPTIEMGTPTEPSSHLMPGVLPSPEEEDLSDLSDGPVQELKINKLLTGGLNTNRQAGDEGVMVVVEPRAADGRLVREPGDLSLMLVDPTKTGPAARVARWDFTSDEAAAAFRKTPLGRGLHFELPWPDGAPDANQLHLYVRAIAPDGRKLLAESDIRIDPNGLPIDEQLAQMAAHTSDASAHRWNKSERLIPTAPEPQIVPAPEVEPAEEIAPPQAPPKKSPKKPKPAEKTAGRPEWKPYR